MIGYGWLLEPRILPWNDADQCELGGMVAAMLAFAELDRRARLPEVGGEPRRRTAGPATPA